MKKAFTFILFSIVISTITSAQNINGLSDGQAVIVEKEYEGVKGSPYLFDEWKRGYIVSKSGDQVNVEIKYNVVSDKILARDKISTPVILNDDYTDSLFIYSDNRTWLFVQLKDVKEIEPGIYQILYNDKITVIVKRSKEVKEAYDHLPYTEGQYYDEFINSDQYYVKFGNQVYSKIKLSRGSIKRAFKLYKDVLKDFLRSNSDVDINTEQGLVETIKFLDAHID